MAPDSTLSLQSNDDVYHALAGRGAAFFRWPIPVGCGPLQRCLPPRRRSADTPIAPTAGPLAADDPHSPYPIVELFDDARRYWTRAYLLLCSHPYAAVTDATGRFHWNAVPTGEWELFVWHPSWTTRQQQRDPESTWIVRQFFTAPLVRRHRIRLLPHQHHLLQVDLSLN
jgi:hypothetical protein